MASFERQFSVPRKPSEKADKAHSQVANRLWSKHCLALTHIFFLQNQNWQDGSGGILSTCVNEHPQSQGLVILALTERKTNALKTAPSQQLETGKKQEGK